MRLRCRTLLWILSGLFVSSAPAFGGQTSLSGAFEQCKTASLGGVYEVVRPYEGAGNPQADFCLARLYRVGGWGAARDLVKAAQFAKSALRLGDPFFQREYAQILFELKDYVAAFPLLKSTAGISLGSQYYLGRSYYFGFGTTVNRALGKELITTVAQQTRAPNEEQIVDGNPFPVGARTAASDLLATINKLEKREAAQAADDKLIDDLAKAGVVLGPPSPDTVFRSCLREIPDYVVNAYEFCYIKAFGKRPQ